MRADFISNYQISLIDIFNMFIPVQMYSFEYTFCDLNKAIQEADGFSSMLHQITIN